MPDLSIKQLEDRVLPPTGPLLPLRLKPDSVILERAQLKAPLLPNSRDFHAGWSVSTYAVPAAFPRSLPSTGTMETRRVDKSVLPEKLYAMYRTQHDAYMNYRSFCPEELKELDKIPEAYASEAQLLLAVNKYSLARKSSNDAEKYTLVMAHANGFHKETWDAFIRYLIDDLKEKKLDLIDEIWSLDLVCEGDSYVLNADVLGNTFAWADNGRDILNFVINYLDSPVDPGSKYIINSSLKDKALLNLDHNPPTLSGRETTPRNIILLGHSVGGCGMSYTAETVPHLLKGVFLVDPVLHVGESYTSSALAPGALTRRDDWKSKKEASDSLLEKPFFRTWDSQVFKSYVDFGMEEDANGARLKGPPYYESLVFADPAAAGSRQGTLRIHQIPSSLPVHMVLADKKGSVLKPHSLDYVTRNAPHFTSTRLEGAGHLIVQERPKQLVSEFVPFLLKLKNKGGRL